MERIVDAVDDLLEEHVHGRFPAPGRTERVERRRERARLARSRDELRQVTAGLLFLRNKLEAEQTERRVRMARACHAILRAAREDDDETALPLLAWRDVLRARIVHAEEELAGVRTQAADAADALARLHRALERLRPRRPVLPERDRAARGRRRCDRGERR